ncbi:MAG: cisplatin damage response ATP-dependent DNA ligase [Bacteroidia bacterium]|nr:cisplatin damage response ATP-dependent DNA ligase [Bacteroidia bacterium]
MDAKPVTFTELCRQLDESGSDGRKVESLYAFFGSATREEALWLLALFSGYRVKAVFSLSRLREYAMERAGLAPWLFDECQAVTGDLSETIALVLPKPDKVRELILPDLMELLQAMQRMEENERKTALFDAWDHLETYGRFLLNKLLTSTFRMTLSRKLICQALSKHTGLDERVLAYRLAGKWSPLQETFHSLVMKEHPSGLHALPFPFQSIEPLEGEVEKLGAAGHWTAEWEWEGWRVQVVKREGEVNVWSEAEDLITDRFPEISDMFAGWPDGVVLEGVLIAGTGDHPKSVQHLEARMRKKQTAKRKPGEIAVLVRVYDLLEWQGKDLREEQLAVRRMKLNRLLESYPSTTILPSVPWTFGSWKALRQVRGGLTPEGSAGILLKHPESFYGNSRKNEGWWKWKPDLLTVDAVMIYAQDGGGNSVFSEFTLAVWQGDSLVPFAKAGAALKEEEIRQVNEYVKMNTREKFGPVRSVIPALVFELGFEGVCRSSRHKSGLRVLFPRILRWRTDKKAEEAHTLGELLKMIRD